ATLVEGWTLVEKYGCFGCHEIGGYEGPLARLGPDLRLEPNYSEVAHQVLRDGGLTGDERDWANTLVEVPGDEAARNRLMVAINQDAQLASRSDSDAEPRLTAVTHKLAGSLKDVEVPGAYRKVGPSLRFLGAKVDFDWLYSWIRKPADFRPSTRMPQFFGQHEHLQDPEDVSELAESRRYEAIEIRALAEFLLANSSEFQYKDPPEEVTEPPSAERGKWLFETRGCLACHSHESFPGIAADQGPDLSRASAKFDTENGALWLYSWLREPHRYHVRTKMPNLYLETIVEKDAAGQPTGKVTDPAADIALFLLGRPVDWEPTDVPGPQWTTEEQEALADLAVEWLSDDTVPMVRAQKFVREGIPNHLEPKLKADEKLLLKKNFSDREEALKQYVARRTIGKYGCFGCHDIPGFEGEKPIGTSLADWGRKETSKLAFENIHKFLEGPGHPHGDHGAYGKDAGHGHLDPGDFDGDTSYYIQSLNSHSRDGFIWQKLRMPRSYDYKTTKNKGFNERLRMPKFPFSADEREAVITFVLGLVNEAPADKFVYHASPGRQAIVDGRMVLDRFNCAGCHTLEMERWQIAFEEDTFESPSTVVDFPFLDKHFSANQVAESLVKDNGGRYHATLNGQPVMNEATGQPERFDEDGLPLEPDDDESDPYYRFTLWKDALVAGEAWLVGLQDLMVPASREGYGPADGQAYPAWGGDLARYLYPKVIAHAKQTNPQVKGSEAWGWLPPPLMAEGEKVQSDWLHGFLMDPTALRPAVVMRMPNFKMSSLEAAKLVNYFAAASGADFPYEYKPQQRASYLAQAEADHPDRLNQAMNIVVDGNYCVKCHAVADFQPQGDVTTFGPNLADVYRRLRPTYVRDWVANPKRILPYTGMPMNIIYKPEDSEHLGGVAQTLFAGTSLEQLRGLVDLLMNFDVYARRQTSITPLVKAVPAGDSQATNVGGAAAPRR
ncbi:MAG: c-type cytochrome, partial [Planctomycetes bacterium]|nr:c-type cytochrome [Planctomycetota bacterium]